jgi:hypothetical protein
VDLYWVSLSRANYNLNLLEAFSRNAHRAQMIDWTEGLAGHFAFC